MTTRCDYYTYILYLPTGSPCYVGCGSGDRATRKRANRREGPALIALERLHGRLESRIAYDNLSRAEAFAYEICLIASIGRADLGAGPLCNETDGGPGALGLIQKPEAVAKTKAARAKWWQGLSEAARAAHVAPAVAAMRRARFGKPISERHRAALVAAWIKRKLAA